MSKAAGTFPIVGLRASVRVVVSESDTAAALGSGDVPVLGTPAPGRWAAGTIERVIVARERFLARAHGRPASRPARRAGEGDGSGACPP